LAAFVYAVVSFRGASGQEGADPVAALRKAMLCYENVEIRATISLDVSSTLKLARGAAPVSQRAPSTTQLLFRRKAGRALISQKEGSTAPSEIDAFLIDHVVYENGDVLQAQAMLGPDLSQLEGVNDSLSFILYSKHLAGVQEVDQERALGRVGDASTLYGFVGGTPLAKYLDPPANVSIDSRSSDPTITSSSQHGRLTLTLSSEFGYLPRAFLLRKRGPDVYNGRRVDEIEMRGDNRIWPRGRVKSIEWEGENVLSRLDNGMPYIKEVRVRRRSNCAGDAVVTFTTHAKVLAITFSPNLADDALNTSIVAPAGYDVTVAGASHLPYEWDGTKPVPRVVRGDTFLGRLSEKRGVTLMLLVINTAFLLALTWFLFQKYRRQQV